MDVRRVRVSRETRLLLTIALVSVAALWLLARIRYPERPATPNPVPPVLAQIVEPSPFESMASSIRELEPRIVPSLAVIQGSSAAPDGAAPADVKLAFRFREDLAIALVPASLEEEGAAIAADPSVVARDSVSGLTLVEVAASLPPALPRWSPPGQRPSARFLIAAAALPDRVALAPVFVGALDSLTTPVWPSEVWILPPSTALGVGTFVFTVDGAWAGVVAIADGRRVLVPPEAVMTIAERLAERQALASATLGVKVQPVTPGLATALGSASGVVVTWVDPNGPAARKLSVFDLIESIDQQPVRSRTHWDARATRLTSGDVVHLRVRRKAVLQDVELTAVARPAVEAGRGHGLTLRSRRGAGAEVLGVDEGSAAFRAGIKAGDVLTQIDSVEKPSAEAARRLLDTASRERPLVLAVDRAGSHRVLTLERTW
jgi:hypothetical protein